MRRFSTVSAALNRNLNVSLNITVKESVPVPAVWLRDACQCKDCVHPSTRQKLFSTGALAPDTTVSSFHSDSGRVVFEESSTKKTHVSYFDKSFLSTHAHRFHGYASLPKKKGNDSLDSPSRNPPLQANTVLTTTLWDSEEYSSMRLARGDVEYASLAKNPLPLLQQLQSYGLAFIRNMPTDKDGQALPELERLVSTLGCVIRDSFYGRTWDVKSVPNSKNIAYTSLDLGLHMDLMYFESPPGIQFLHSLKNSVSGGDSIFLDSFKAALTLKSEFPHHYKTLTTIPLTYHYDNDGRLMKQHHLCISENNLSSEAPFGLKVFYAPPFQGSLECVRDAEEMEQVVEAVKAFESVCARPGMTYVTRLEPGTCVVFRNLRVLHGRTGFKEASGERHFKGAYVDYDVVRDRLEYLSRQNL